MNLLCCPSLRCYNSPSHLFLMAALDRRGSTESKEVKQKKGQNKIYVVTDSLALDQNVALWLCAKRS